MTPCEDKGIVNKFPSLFTCIWMACIFSVGSGERNLNCSFTRTSFKLSCIGHNKLFCNPGMDIADTQQDNANFHLSDLRIQLLQFLFCTSLCHLQRGNQKLQRVFRSLQCSKHCLPEHMYLYDRPIRFWSGCHLLQPARLICARIESH